MDSLNIYLKVFLIIDLFINIPGVSKNLFWKKLVKICSFVTLA